MRKPTRLLAPLFLLLLSACRTYDPAPLPPSAGKLLVTFSAMGDVPYEPQEEDLLRKHVRQIPRSSEFVIHVGDIQKNQKEIPCGEAKYQLVAKILGRSAK